MPTDASKCDICRKPVVWPKHYGYWECPHCHQAYDYYEGLSATLTDAQWALLRNQSRWIPVEERWPRDDYRTDDGDLLLWQDHGDGCGAQVVGYFIDGEFWLYEDDNTPAAEAGVTITHWRQLPDDPEGTRRG